MVISAGRVMPFTIWENLTSAFNSEKQSAKSHSGIDRGSSLTRLFRNAGLLWKDLLFECYESVQLAPWLGSRSTVSITAKVCLISTAVVRFISANTDAVLNRFLRKWCKQRRLLYHSKLWVRIRFFNVFKRSLSCLPRLHLFDQK